MDLVAYTLRSHQGEHDRRPDSAAVAPQATLKLPVLSKGFIPILGG
jgi:hypothetical protein